MEENAALCDEVAQVQTELCAAREERRYLVKRLLRHEGFENIEKEKNSAEAGVLSTQKLSQPKKRGPKKRQRVPAEQERDIINFNQNKFDVDVYGKPKLPINLSNILLHSLGEIIPTNPNFHNEHWVYPVGYMITRIYAHPKEPQRKCVFTCKILNNAGMPQFQIIPDNDLDSVFFGESANICHQGLLETLQRSLADVAKLPLRVQGEKFFGLANTTVQSLLQLHENIKQCANFKGFVSTAEWNFSEDKDPTICYEALQSIIAISAYHTMPEVKDEPPDELFELN
uniref:Transforming growth factor beta regulator 1 n=1 Tax=Glossina brevipalpis TaxID=37001 RepID=A0A1A9WKZ1_9MUSC